MNRDSMTSNEIKRARAAARKGERPDLTVGQAQFMLAYCRDIKGKLDIMFVSEFFKHMPEEVVVKNIVNITNEMDQYLSIIKSNP